MDMTQNELDLLRQWFNAVQDVNPRYLQIEDYALAVRLYNELGMRAPESVLLRCLDDAVQRKVP